MEKQSYTYDEALKASLEYFDGDELAACVWVNKYAMKDSFGVIYEKSPEQMHWRIANEIARIVGAEPVQAIGFKFVLYRRSDDVKNPIEI